MAEETPSLHIDNDWKKQAQEEKRRLAEQAAAKAAPSAASPAAAPASPAAGSAAPRGRGGPGGRGGEMPKADLATLVSSVLTQVLYYLGDLATRGGEPVVNLDLAKHHLDTLGVLEQKTANNLSPEEQRALDTALYEGRTRFVQVASQYIA